MSVRRRRLFLVGGLVVLGIASLLFVADATHTVIPGDPAVYRDRVVAIIEGGVPYRDVPIEHLPAMLIPMFGVWWLGGAVSQSAYVFTYACLMIVAMAATGGLVDRLAVGLGHQSGGFRWLLITTPLLPLVIFRNDPVVTFLFVLSAVLWASDRAGWSFVAIAGAFAKVWPASMALAGMRRRQRLQAAAVAAAGVVSVAWTFLPGFTDARQGVGIHAETFVGAFVGLWRSGSGEPSRMVLTTAAYLPAGTQSLALNAALGLAVVVVGAWAVSRARTDRLALLGIGTVVGGVILASQLFSLQYLLWLMPFVALATSIPLAVVAAALAALTTGLAWVWEPALFESASFYFWITIRNIGVLLLALWLAFEATEGHLVGGQQRIRLADNGGDD